MISSHITDKILRYWWLCSLICLATTAGMILMEVYNYHLPWLEDVLGAGFLITAGLQILLLITALVRRHFMLAIGIFASGVVIIFAFMMLCFMWWMLQGESDDFGKRHPIPTGMVCQEPDESFCEEDVDSTETATWLRIQNNSQGGIYDYQYYSNALPDGYIYLKCYEATENILLSEDRIIMRTKIEVKQHNTFGQVGGDRVFTIYEGSWGDYYPIRVEVWHHEAMTGHERLLNQKVYKMQGWQR